MSRGRWRRLRFGLATLLGRRPRGFFIPYRYAAEQPSPPGYAALEPRFAAREAAFRAVLADIDAHGGALRAIAGPPPEPRWDQDWFPRLDAAAAYAIVRRHRPRRIVEIGSGHSTRFLARAVRDGGLGTEIVAIDPAPRADLSGLAAVALRRTTLQAALPLPPLAAGDIMFVDSSHILMPGTDVDLLLGTVLPALPAGTLVHVHDIFLPDAYPREWAWRGYNEQAAIAPFLWTGAFDLLFASRYVATRLTSAVAASAIGDLPLPEGAWETSLWLMRKADGS